jgi:hypothetical protein
MTQAANAVAYNCLRCGARVCRELGVKDQVARGEAVVAALDMGLPHAVDEIVVVQRADDEAGG